MKRRSMLGRRQSRLLQPPAAPGSSLRPPPFSTLNSQLTPEQSSRLDNPFQTPTVNGSLSEVANEDPWSVFKCVKNGLKSPLMESTDLNVFRNPQGEVHIRESALKNNYNRKKQQKLAEKSGGVMSTASTKTIKFEFPVYKHQRAAINFPESDSNERTPCRNNGGGGGGVTETRSTASTKTIKFEFPIYKNQQAAINFSESDSNEQTPARSFNGDVTETTRSNCMSSKPIKPFEFSVYKHQRFGDRTTADVNTKRESETRPALRDNSTEKKEGSQQGTQSPWECQDIRNLSPPWSNGHNTLNDFNLMTPRPPSRVTSSPFVTEASPVDLCNSLAYPLEVTVMENTIVQAKVSPLAEKTPTNQDQEDGKMDLKSALSEVSLGVNSLELLDKLKEGEWTTKSWTSRPTLQKLPEIPGELEDKENFHPNHQDDGTIGEEESNSGDTFLSPSQGSSSSKNSGREVKKILERLIDLNSKIEEAEEERDSAEERIRLANEERRMAEEKRRKLEYQRKMLNYELLEEMSQAPSIYGSQAPKRRKLGPPSAKKGPSFVASKILKRDFGRTPVRTPRRSFANDTLSVNSILNPFTPKTLRKNINDQYDQIFGN